ncbi:MAG: 50S ribosomal protein L22 [Candidatus Margulisiibacteriota bacterium]|jgi:large subunit ribosomal protein L22
MVNVKAKSKWVRSSPRKIMRVMNEVRGKSVAEALALLKFMPQKAARIIEKTMKSAIANATNNYKLNEAKLVLGEVFVTKGFVMKRFQPRARGRAFPIKKRTSHVTVSVQEAK